MSYLTQVVAMNLRMDSSPRAAAKVVEGHTVNGNLNAMIVPGSGLVSPAAAIAGHFVDIREWR